MNFPRASGVLLHPTSLPGNYPIGDLGPRAFEFVDFLVATKQTYWQILPLTPTGWGDSPYSSFSAFAGNTLLISPEKLAEDGLIEITTPPKTGGELGRVDYGAAYELKTRLLSEAFEKFRDDGGELRASFDEFVDANSSWLDDYALYRAIKASQDHRPWFEWDDPLKLRHEDAIAIENATNELGDAIFAEKFSHFLFYKQWSELRTYANEKGIRIVGDVPIFVALDSADVWCNRDQFKLNDDGSPRVVSGVPPDYFSTTGQLWGNPIYDWDAMLADGFGWWIARVRETLTLVDVVRVDHFRGFGSAWEVPGGDPTAEHGEWVDAPGRELFGAIKEAIGDLPFWAEDLGHMTPDVEAIRDDFELPGMRILQFAFGGDARDQNLPHNYIRRCVAYTGTHDNDTTVGWWDARDGDEESPNREREAATKYLDTDGEAVHWDFVRAVLASVADSAVIPLQDLLGLGNDARMNLPASMDGNWSWRLREGDLTDDIRDRLSEMTEIYGRARE